MSRTFYEFFAGGGMARAGLGTNWNCVFSNDFDHKKAKTYCSNWGQDEFVSADVKTLTADDLPSKANLVWASFPCQDLSLAGGGAGLRGERSGTFWPFWNLISELRVQNRAPDTIVLENVCGTLTSHEGKDFKAICEALDATGYKFGACVIDAKYFLPQSRPRLFIIAVNKSVACPPILLSESTHEAWHSKALIKAYNGLEHSTKKNWIWWRLPTPLTRKHNFIDLIEDAPQSVTWHSELETNKILSMMSDVNLKKVEQAKAAGKKVVGALYKRTRKDKNGAKVQRAEVRFDDVAGCLRTPSGGSSRQLIMIVEGETVRTRLISSRETARLMGLPDTYKIPDNYNEAYHLTGDGVAVPVVSFIANNILEPIFNFNKDKSRKAA